MSYHLNTDARRRILLGLAAQPVSNNHRRSTTTTIAPSSRLHLAGIASLALLIAAVIYRSMH